MADKKEDNSKKRDVVSAINTPCIFLFSGHLPIFLLELLLAFIHHLWKPQLKVLFFDLYFQNKFSFSQTRDDIFDYKSFQNQLKLTFWIFYNLCIISFHNSYTWVCSSQINSNNSRKRNCYFYETKIINWRKEQIF